MWETRPLGRNNERDKWYNILYDLEEASHGNYCERSPSESFPVD